MDIFNALTNIWVAQDSDIGKVLLDLDGPEKDAQTAHVQTFYKQLKYLETLDSKYIKALQVYTGSSYAAVNEVLRSGGEATLVHKMSALDTIRMMDKIFRGIPPLQHDIVLWRGIRMKPKVLENFTEPGYISASFDQNEAYEFVDKEYKCCVFKIMVPKGTHVIPLYTCSTAFFEQEVLLPRGGRITFAQSDNTVMHYKEHSPPTKEFTIDIERGYKVTHNGTMLEDAKGGMWRIQPLDKIANDNEYLGYKLYTLFKVKVTDMKRVKIDGNCYLVKKYEAGVTRPDYTKARADFIIDALLANPSVVKNMYTNSRGDIVRDELGIRVFDSGTATTVPEVKSMLKLEPFKDVTEADVEMGLSKIKRVTKSEIKKVVGNKGGVDLLMDRIKYILVATDLYISQR